ncbi:37966_t:CDS:2 [Gigaspora margarita]|uniref:37966_t:CDS:1 n=1 Tax=Gigaspora margarita TaxID=4874 RepID=A0ABN7VN89_GIGMA|nr:37966_t:CDS:2 [Gigaspora margarita]
MPETSEPNKYRKEEAKDFLIENNSGVQQLISNIKEYTYLIDQPVITKDALTNEGLLKW